MPLPGSQVGLTPKQRRFVEEYLVDLNAERAAMRAGYSRSTARKNAYTFLQSAKVAEAIAAAQAELTTKISISVERIVAELARIGFSDIREVVHWRSSAAEAESDGGEANGRVANVVELKNAADLAPDVAAAIAEISQLPNGGLRVKLHDKRAALVDLGKHLGMFTERREHASAMTVEIVRFGQDQGSR